MISHELNNIEVNKRRIHGDLRYFFMYLLNLIKSDDKMRLKLGILIYLERELEGKSME